MRRAPTRPPPTRARRVHRAQPGAAGPGPAWTAAGGADDSGSPPWGPPGPLGPPPPGRYGRYGYRPGRPRRYRGRTPVAAGWRYVLLALGIVTLGFAWLLGAILCWVGFFRTRRRAGSGPPAAPVHWLRWAVIFSVLGLIVVPLSLNAVINGNNSRSGSGSSSPPFTMKTVPLGTPVTVRTDLGVDLQMVPATVTATAVQPAPATGGTATVDLKVCATTQSVDPSFAADGLELGTTGSNNLVADTNLLQASSTFGQVLPPGHCSTGSVPVSVPANTNVTSVQLPSLEVGATWTLS